MSANFLAVMNSLYFAVYTIARDRLDYHRHRALRAALPQRFTLVTRWPIYLRASRHCVEPSWFLFAAA